MSRNNEHIQQSLYEARLGSRASMGHLAVIIWERLYPFVFRVTLRHDVTEDILQETLLTVVRQVSSLRESRRFWPWVYRIAWSKIQDTFRRRRRSSTRALLLWNRYYANNSQSGSSSLLDTKIREETLQQVWAMVEQLNHQHRDVLRLRCHEQLPYERIASITNTTPEQVRVRFYRARKLLKTRLLACCV